MEPLDEEHRAARTRRLYRYISEAIRKVDEGTGRSKTILELFAPTLEIHRQKLRENCEKLVFADPLLHGRKAQELLWRKGYYETFSAAKRLRANGKKYDELVLSHIYSGIGHYHNLISRIQTDMEIDMTDLIDFPILDIKPDSDMSQTDKRAEIVKWAKSSIQACLVYLGDLNRYKSEYEDDHDISMSVRYYFQAAGVDPDSGTPHNQLGTLFTGKYYSLDSVKYYIICLSCVNPFEGAEGNLVRIFDKNNKYLEYVSKQSDVTAQQESIKNFVCKFLSLVDCCYFEKNVDNFNDLCTGVLYDLKECLQFTSSSKPNKGASHSDLFKYAKQQETAPDHLSDKILNKIVIIVLLCINKLQKTNSSRLFALKAFTLAFLSQLLQKLSSDLINVGFKIQTPDEIIEERKEKIRNYKNIKNSTKDNPSNGHEDKIDQPTEKIEEVRNVDDDVENLKMNEHKTSKEDSEKIIENIPKSGDGSEPENGKITKAKGKKSVMKNLRRRRRRLNSTSSQEDSESDISMDCSDIEEKNGNESDSENECSEASYFTYTTSEEEDDELCNNGEGLKNGKNRNSPMNSDNENDFGSHDNVSQYSNQSSNGNVPEKKGELSDVSSENNHSVDNRPSQKTVFDEELLKEFLDDNNLLTAVRTLLFWLHSESEFLISCRFNGRAMFQTLVDVLNIVNRQIFPRLNKNTYDIAHQYHSSLWSFHEKILSLKYKYKTMPLPEDYDLKMIDLFKNNLKDMNWNLHKTKTLSIYECKAIRFLKLIDFGVFIVKLKIGIIFNRRLKMYTFKKNKINRKNINNAKKFNKDTKHLQSKSSKQCDKNGPQSEGLMRSLGKLWLSAQVRELESEVRAGRHQHGLPAYVVVDAEALSRHTYYVMRLVSSKKLIVLIPTIVLQLMDELKKESKGARSAIRWLEFQLRNGSHFLKAQRSTETASVPNVKYPKKMSRDLHNFVQIIEFCYYFISQENTSASSKDPEGENTPSNGINGESSNEAEAIEKSDDNRVTSSINNNNNHILILLTGSKYLDVSENGDISCATLAKTAGVPVENIQDFCTKKKSLFVKSSKNR